MRQALYIFTFIIVWSGTLGAPLAHAASTQETLTISPAIEKITVARGQAYEKSLTIVNSGSRQLKVRIYGAPYSIKDVDYNADFTTETSRGDIYKWLEIQTTTWTIEPQKSVTVPYTVHVSAGAQPGGHYGTIFVETQESANEQSAGVTRQKRLGMVIYANVEGNAQTSGTVTKMNTPWYQQVAPLTTTLQFANTGETDFDAAYAVSVTDLQGHVVSDRSGSVAVLPATERRATITWDQVPWVGLYNVRTTATVPSGTAHDEHIVFIAPAWLLAIGGMAVIVVIWRVIYYAAHNIRSRR